MPQTTGPLPESRLVVKQKRAEKAKRSSVDFASTAAGHTNVVAQVTTLT
jgi:hypothetical protein